MKSHNQIVAQFAPEVNGIQTEAGLGFQTDLTCASTCEAQTGFCRKRDLATLPRSPGWSHSRESPGILAPAAGVPADRRRIAVATAAGPRSGARRRPPRAP